MKAARFAKYLTAEVTHLMVSKWRTRVHTAEYKI